jgi:hypothetical protein
VTSQRNEAATSAITVDDLTKVSRAKVFFGHQSVGMNVLNGVAGVYRAHGMAAPAIELGEPDPDRDGGFIGHAFIGENGQPQLKVQDFDAKMRSGLGRRTDVAMMKFCYVDVTADTDVDALFATYRETLAALQHDFPEVTFIYVTVPLTTAQGLLSKLKTRIAGVSGYSPADNAARERLNALIRRAYAGQQVFDLAAVESTAPDGSRDVATYEGQRYYQLDNGYAADSGHLNDAGARVAAIAWLKTIARAFPG